MLASKEYVPLLKTRVSEVEAFQFLSNDAKSRTFPIFLLRPWPNANHLNHSIHKVTEAANGHPFGLGLDQERYRHNSSKPAQAEFDELFDNSRGFEIYYDFISEIENAVPVLLPSNDANNLLLQLGNAEDLDRGLIIHQRRDSLIPISDTIINLPPLPNDTTFVVDAAWARDPLLMQSWAIPTAQRIHEALPSAELVIMSSSFLDSFGHIVGSREEPAFERQVFEAVRRQLQSADLTYGDWGSTRLPQNGGGGIIPARVDIPRPTSWQIFRSDGDKSDYLAMALQAQSHVCFESAPDCWGKMQVQATDGKGSGITGPKMNTSSRINLHMTIQSGAEHSLDTDEQPFED